MRHGWICLNKLRGVTSTQALARVRRVLDRVKAGHCGTLDPIATGVLPITTVFVVPFGGKNMEEVCVALKKLEPFFRSRLNQAVRLRYIPSLRFKGDRSFDHAHRIEQTLKHIHQNRATS